MIVNTSLPWAVVVAPGCVIDELADDRKASVLGVVPKLPELRLGVLVLIERRDPGVEGDALRCAFGGGHKGV